ncbi:n-acetyltransferase eco [Anaeramoeba flamelloides]|uniref:N-acetyltransferase eco n=1 Tax=Anaeramoeba flamelloides TaxID=1746091 RepID=A0AAV7ZUF2_9EUKA|nr:n-acetyltransferase eco [Anaeramoeba flamelloides]
MSDLPSEKKISQFTDMGFNREIVVDVLSYYPTANINFVVERVINYANEKRPTRKRNQQNRNNRKRRNFPRNTRNYVGFKRLKLTEIPLNAYTQCFFSLPPFLSFILKNFPNQEEIETFKEKNKTLYNEQRNELDRLSLINSFHLLITKMFFSDHKSIQVPSDILELIMSQVAFTFAYNTFFNTINSMLQISSALVPKKDNDYFLPIQNWQEQLYLHCLVELSQKDLYSSISNQLKHQMDKSPTFIIFDFPIFLSSNSKHWNFDFQDEIYLDRFLKKNNGNCELKNQLDKQINEKLNIFQEKLNPFLEYQSTKLGVDQIINLSLTYYRKEIQKKNENENENDNKKNDNSNPNHIHNTNINTKNNPNTNKNKKPQNNTEITIGKENNENNNKIKNKIEFLSSINEKLKKKKIKINSKIKNYQQKREKLFKELSEEKFIFHCVIIEKRHWGNPIQYWTYIKDHSTQMWTKLLNQIVIERVSKKRVFDEILGNVGSCSLKTAFFVNEKYLIKNKKHINITKIQNNFNNKKNIEIEIEKEKIIETETENENKSENEIGKEKINTNNTFQNNLENNVQDNTEGGLKESAKEINIETITKTKTKEFRPIYIKRKVFKNYLKTEISQTLMRKIEQENILLQKNYQEWKSQRRQFNQNTVELFIEQEKNNYEKWRENELLEYANYDEKLDPHKISINWEQEVYDKEEERK